MNIKEEILNDYYSRKKALKRQLIAASDNIVSIRAAKEIAKENKIKFQEILRNLIPSNNTYNDKSWDKDGNIIKI